MKALYPGTFDPMTNGHLDVIRRAAQMFEQVTVAVSDHGRKQTLFNLPTRCTMLQQAVSDLPNVDVVSFTNLAVNCARDHNAKAIIRGLRVTSDFEYEFTMAKFMDEQDKDIEVVYLMAAAHLTHISSTAVKEIARLGGDITKYVPASIAQAIMEKMKVGEAA